MVDGVVVGAGLAGLICARSMQSAGYSVMVLEKSRGLGGRVATRRLKTTRFDHGARYFEKMGPYSTALLDSFLAEPQSEMRRWPAKSYMIEVKGDRPLPTQSEGYVPEMGMTAIAKHLAEPLHQIQRQQRVSALKPTAQHTWDIYVESQAEVFTTARAVVLAIPAPQAIPLLEPLTPAGLPAEFLDAVQSVIFDPCITVIAGYPAPLSLYHPVMGADWDAITFRRDEVLQWVGVDSRKHRAVNSSDTPGHTVLVTQSSSSFAQQYWDSPFNEETQKRVGDRLLTAVANRLTLPRLTHPAWMQVHRWRYAFCNHPLPQSFLLTQTPALLGCAGDWCGGNRIEDALYSGHELAAAIAQEL